MKMKPATYQTRRSHDPSVPLMKIVNEGKPTNKALRAFLTRNYNLPAATIDRMLRTS